MGKKNGKNVSENAGSKYSQKLLVHAKQSATYTPKTASKRAIQKTAEPIGDLVSNEIADRIRKVSKTSQQSTLEIVTNEHDKEVSKQRYIYLQKKNRKLLIIWYQYNSVIMEYQKRILNLLDNKPNQPSKFRTKNCAEVNDDLQ